MKISQEKKFQPVTIVIESADELAVLCYSLKEIQFVQTKLHEICADMYLKLKEVQS